MRRWVLAVLLSVTAALPAVAAERCDGCSKPRRGHRLRDRLGDRLGDRLHRRDCRACLQLDCGTGKTHHELGCTGCKGECIFVFGSCWEFFEEACYPKPRPPQTPYPYPYPYPYQRPPEAAKFDAAKPESK